MLPSSSESSVRVFASVGHFATNTPKSSYVGRRKLALIILSAIVAKSEYLSRNTDVRSS